MLLFQWHCWIESRKFTPFTAQVLISIDITAFFCTHLDKPRARERDYFREVASTTWLEERNLFSWPCDRTRARCKRACRGDKTALAARYDALWVSRYSAKIYVTGVSVLRRWLTHLPRYLRTRKQCGRSLPARASLSSPRMSQVPRARKQMWHSDRAGRLRSDSFAPSMAFFVRGANEIQRAVKRVRSTRLVWSICKWNSPAAAAAAVAVVSLRETGRRGRDKTRSICLTWINPVITTMFIGWS